ncbi:hypothetical protein C8R46DRAFT_1226589 [Mycena filopes]|nr:hypothetical protein C8R46DRAFT_1226589 [Mycena filopes]
MSKRKKGNAREVRIKPESDTEIKTELDSGSEFDEVELALQLPVKRARNPTGKNQYASVPLLEDLEGILCQYHTQNHHFKYQDYIDALGRDHGITIGRSTLAKYLGALGLSTSARGNRMPNSDKTQIILDELAKDPLQTRGPCVVKEALDLVGHKISRDYISAIMHDFEAEGFEKRQPHAKKALERTPLTSVGPDEEWSVDGHDKLDVAGFGIYGIRDKWGKRYHHYRVVPSNWYAAVVGVLYLECVKKRGGEFDREFL